MKKTVLFVIDSLNCAGAEKSLTTLLSLLDYSRYEIDLQLLGYGGELESILPREVNLLPPLEYTSFAKLSIKEAIILSLKEKNFKLLRARIIYSTSIRKHNLGNVQKARVFWEHTYKVIKENIKYYDVAIAYAQGIPTFYVANKIRAIKKIAWINVSYKIEQKEKKFLLQFYDVYNQIIVVSDIAKKIFLEQFSQYKYKTSVIYDIYDIALIDKMARLFTAYLDEFKGVRILTIGRLASGKGYDIAIEACKKLRAKNIQFRWYVLGQGPLQEEIRESIRHNNLEEHFILLGVKDNPYPYIKDCDIYVQTSKYEGFGLAIAEARMLNRPIVTTRFDTVYSQMVEGENGLVVDMNADAVCEGIIRLIEDKDLKVHISEYLKAEKKGNAEEIEKFYKLID